MCACHGWTPPFSCLWEKFFIVPLITMTIDCYIKNLQSPNRCCSSRDDIILTAWSHWCKYCLSRHVQLQIKVPGGPGGRKRKLTSGKGLAPPRGRGSSLSVPEIKILARVFRHCSIFNPLTLDTSLLTLSCCLWSHPSPSLPHPTPTAGAQTGLATGGSNSGHPPTYLSAVASDCWWVL